MFWLFLQLLDEVMDFGYPQVNSRWHLIPRLCSWLVLSLLQRDPELLCGFVENIHHARGSAAWSWPCTCGSLSCTCTSYWCCLMETWRNQVRVNAWFTCGLFCPGIARMKSSWMSSKTSIFWCLLRWIMQGAVDLMIEKCGRELFWRAMSLERLSWRPTYQACQVLDLILKYFFLNESLRVQIRSEW